MATQSTIWPWVRPSLHPPEHRFPWQKEEDRRDMWRRPHRQPKMVLLFPYSCKSYVSACTVFIPHKTLVDPFFLHLNSQCTRFLLIYYFTLARGSSPSLDFNSWSVDSQLKEAFPGVTDASLPITPGKQC